MEVGDGLGFRGRWARYWRRGDELRPWGSRGVKRGVGGRAQVTGRLGEERAADGRRIGCVGSWLWFGRFVACAEGGLLGPLAGGLQVEAAGSWLTGWMCWVVGGSICRG